jgi:hypothetical protein
VALTAPQLTKMTELEDIITALEKTYKQSPTLMNLAGNYLFNEIAIIRAKIVEIKGA